MSESGRQPESATFEVSRVSSGRGRPPLLLLAFVTALGGMVALGVSGRSQPEPSVPPIAVATPAILPPEDVVPGYARLSVRLDAPAEDDLVVSDVVPVVGRLEVKAETLRIELRGENQRVLDSRLLDTSNHDGGIRPLQAPTFDFDLVIPPGTAAGRLWIVATAFSETGTEIVSTARRIQFTPRAQLRLGF